MKRKFTKLVSAALAVCMLTAFIPEAFAETPLAEGKSEIAFSAARYNVSENEGTFKVKIIRSGGNDRAVSAAFKSADFTANYGEDYVVLDEKGKELPVIDGIAPEHSDFDQTSSTERIFTEVSDSSPAQLKNETAENEDKSAETVITDDGTAGTAPPLIDAGAAQSDELLALSNDMTENDEQSDSPRTGSSLLDAQAKYLNLPDDNAKTRENIETALTDVNDYFQNARGAMGVITFEKGESEKEIIVKIIDNDKPEADKIVMLALMGINGDGNTVLAANPTAYLNIIDDEEYEKPVIAPDTAEVTLTENAAEYELKLIRKSGVDYYTSVSVSTVKETAAEGVDYDKIENASVAFAPGETEKIIKLTANSFDADKSYGIRLESDGTCDIDNEYIKVNIAEKNMAEDIPDSADNEEEVSLMSEVQTRAADIAGSAQTTLKLDSLNMEHGPSTGSQSGWYGTSRNEEYKWTDYIVYETCWKSGRTWVAKNPINLSGVNNITVSHQNDGGYWGRYGAFHMFVEILKEKDRFNYDSSGDARIRADGYHRWQSGDINVSKLNGDYYLRFGVRNDGWATDNGRAWLGNPVTIKWKKYLFDINSRYAVQNFHRFQYDYADNAGKQTKIQFDVNDDYDYNPGTVHFENSDGVHINGFYANANQTIKPVSDNKYDNDKCGIELEGVYLYNKAESELYYKNLKAPYEEHWHEDHTVWIPASGVNLNQDFAKKIDLALGADVSSVKVMPKFRQKEVQVTVNKADGEKTYIANMNDTYTFPIYSKLKLRAIAAPKKTITGFNVNNTVISDSNTPERMEYVIKGNTSITPCTGNQDMNIEYMPNADKVISDLDGRVYREPSVMDSSTVVAKSDKNGSINIETVHPGMMWIMRAAPPEGYYVKWTNGTGDVKIINGRIDVNSDPNINEENANTMRGNYEPVYGNIMSGRINQDNTKYYYEFVKNSNESRRVWGNIKRKKGSFYDISRGSQLPLENVKATQVSIAGIAGYTDQNGDFSINLTGVPTSGRVSVIVDDDGTQYPAVALANYMSITLPAYECFKPKSISINYSSDKNKINGTVANIFDDTLNIFAEVEANGTIQPVKAKFYIHKTNGQVIDCSGDKRFNISCTNNTAFLSFNPKAIMDSGDKIYVAYIDQNDKEYKSIDTGYSFVAPLNLRSFMFPLIGSDLIEGAYGGATELIGDPLGNISLGKIGFNEPETKTVTPPGMDPDKYTYIQSSYTFGDYSKALKTFSGKYPKKKDNPKETEKPSSKDLSDAAKDAVKDSGKETENGGYKTNKSFSWSLSPKAAFGIQITTRQDKNGEWKYYFEELDFLVGLDFNVEGKVTVTLPIGMNIIITAGLSGDVTGIFQLKTNYSGDSTWDKNKVEYSAESFGLFKEIDHVDRTAYILLNPTITLGLGVEVAIVEIGGSAKFDFDMDFKFGLNSGNLYNQIYGDMGISFDYYIKVLSIKVYSGKSGEVARVKLFSNNADGHIEPDVMAELFSLGEENEIQSIPVTRDYLKNTSEWNCFANNISLYDIGAADGTIETVLQENIYPSSQFKLTSFGDNNILMTFIGDVPSRSDINRTGLYYSVFDGISWSLPKLIDDDGTLDDYPDVFDMGDKIMVSWSSAEKPLSDSATAAEALTALDIKTAFFDKAARAFGEVTQITRTTAEDYTADIEPKAVYDRETDRIILYYTKTEYKNMQTLSELLNSPSAVAYRFYENGEWNDGESYSEDELLSMDAADKESYKTNWYGQRFLDVRLNEDSGKMPRIVDSDASYCNGRSLYAWTVDYDDDLNTTNDRDVFMQIYNFAENRFTHMIRVTADAGNYSMPRFGQCMDETYLFFSAAGSLGGEDENTSGIAYVNVSDSIKDDIFASDNDTYAPYYTLDYQVQLDEMTDSAGSVIDEQEKMIAVRPAYAVKMNGYVNSYSVDCDENGVMYLTWTDFVADEDAQRHVFTSVYDSDAAYDAQPDENEKIKTESGWSEPFVLTDEPSTSYTNIDAAVIDGELYIAANKIPYIKNSGSASLDEADADMVILKHTPYAKPVTAGENALAADTGYVYSGTGFRLTSSVKNEGVKLINEPVTFRFSMTAGGKTTDLGEKTLNKVWGGGKTLSASVDVPAIYDIPDDMKFNVEITVEDNVINQELKAVKEYNIISENDAVTDEKTDGHEISVSLRNSGNIPSNAVKMTIYTVKDGKKDEKIAEVAEDSIDANTSETITADIKIPDRAYTITGGDGTADLAAVIETDGKELKTLETTAHKSFDENAIEVMSKITGVSIKGSDKIDAKYLDEINIEAEISGTDTDKVEILWISDNEDAVFVRDDGTLCAVGNGIANLTGYVVPNEQRVVFSYDGTSEKEDMLSLIPDTLYKTVTKEIIVFNFTNPTNRIFVGFVQFLDCIRTA